MRVAGSTIQQSPITFRLRQCSGALWENFLCLKSSHSATGTALTLLVEARRLAGEKMVVVVGNMNESH